MSSARNHMIRSHKTHNRQMAAQSRMRYRATNKYNNATRQKVRAFQRLLDFFQRKKTGDAE